MKDKKIKFQQNFINSAKNNAEISIMLFPNHYIKKQL